MSESHLRGTYSASSNNDHGRGGPNNDRYRHHRTQNVRGDHYYHDNHRHGYGRYRNERSAASTGYNHHHDRRNDQYYRSRSRSPPRSYYRHEQDFSRRDNGYRSSSDYEYNGRNGERSTNRGYRSDTTYSRNDRRGYEIKKSGSTDGDGWETVPSRGQRRRNESSRRESYSLGGSRGNDYSVMTPKLVDLIPPTDLNKNFEPFLLMLVGVPGSGKSTFAKALEKAMPYKYIRVNQDSLGTRRDCEELCKSILNDAKCPVIDRCNFNPQQRRHFLDIAKDKNVKVDAIVFTYPMEECIRRCEQRRDHETIRPGEAREVLERMVREFSPPLPNRENLEKYRNVRNVTDLGTHNDLVMEYLSSPFL